MNFSLIIFLLSIIPLLLFSNCAALPGLPLANSSVPFRIGRLLVQSAQEAQRADGQFLQFGGESEENDFDDKIPEEDKICQMELANRLRAELEGKDENGLLNFGENLLAQILVKGKREKICRIYSSQSAALNKCVGQFFSSDVGFVRIHTIHLLLQSICGQFAEAFDAHGQCLSELQIGRLEGQCAHACQRQADSALPSQRTSDIKSSASFALCQLALCSINCFGAQLSECAEEAEPKGDPAKLKAMIDQLAGLQMIIGMASEKKAAPIFQKIMIGEKQMPMECEQFIGKATTSASLWSRMMHDAEPSAHHAQHQQQIPLERAKRAVLKKDIGRQ